MLGLVLSRRRRRHSTVVLRGRRWRRRSRVILIPIRWSWRRRTRVFWSRRRGSRRHGAQIRGGSRRRGGRRLPALGRRPLHGRVRLVLRAQAAVGTRRDAACLLDLARGGGGVGGLRGGVGGEGLPEGLRLLRCLLDGLAEASCGGGHGARVAAPGLEVFGEQLDEVGGEEPDHAPVALQAAHPPRAIAGVEALDQVSFYEAEVAFCLRWSGQRDMILSVRWCVPLTSPPHEYTALHQHGKRVGRPGAAGAMATV